MVKSSIPPPPPHLVIVCVVKDCDTPPTRGKEFDSPPPSSPSFGYCVCSERFWQPPPPTPLFAYLCQWNLLTPTVWSWCVWWNLCGQTLVIVCAALWSIFKDMEDRCIHFSMFLGDWETNVLDSELNAAFSHSETNVLDSELNAAFSHSVCMVHYTVSVSTWKLYPCTVLWMNK